MKRGWREFETLIARLERQLAPAGAEVVSPYPLPDSVSGRQRKVDAAILVNGVLLAVVECRNRKRPAGAPWIDELVGRRKALQVPKLIAVSASGFTKPALKKARAEGIDTRRVDELSADAILTWMPKGNAIGLQGAVRPGPVTVSFYPATDMPAERVRAFLDSTKWESEVLRIYPSGTSTSYEGLVMWAITKHISELNPSAAPGQMLSLPSGAMVPFGDRVMTAYILDGVPMGEPAFKRFDTTWPRGTLKLVTPDGEFDVRLVSIHVIAAWKGHPVKGTSLTYSDDRSVLRGAYDVEIAPGDGGDQKFSVTIGVSPPEQRQEDDPGLSP